MPNSILEGLATTIENITQILSYLNPFDENFILKDLLDWLNPTSENFILKQLWDFLTNIVSYINPFDENFFGYKIIDLFNELFNFLFVPSEDVVNGLVDSVKSKFSFIDTIKSSVSDVEDILVGAEAVPTLKIHVNRTEYTQEQDLTIINFAWYVPFKKYGDIILTAFIYAFFFWRIYISLPNIISGTGGAINDIPSQVSDIEAYRRFGFGRSVSTKRGGGNQRR